MAGARQSRERPDRDPRPAQRRSDHRDLHSFPTRRSSDLRLRQGIQSLNREARERLNQSFDVVNKHFQQLFTNLFGGGTAELQLIESEDPLEAGLDIMAKPPGKKPQTLSLLSGGEQALTALALIFAVFLTNPAPICVLDEVDAPLDDAKRKGMVALHHDVHPFLLAPSRARGRPTENVLTARAVPRRSR